MAYLAFCGWVLHVTVKSHNRARRWYLPDELVGLDFFEQKHVHLVDQRVTATAQRLSVACVFRETAAPVTRVICTDG